MTFLWPLLLLVVLWLPGAARAQAAGVPPDPTAVLAAVAPQVVLTITQAVFERPDGDRLRQGLPPGPPGPSARTVALPDTWTQRGLRGRDGPGRYHWTVTLPAQATQAGPAGTAWMLQASRLSPRLRLWINGRLAHDTLHAAHLLRRPMPTMLALPPALLQSGPNHFVLDIDPGQRAGLSALRLGAYDQVDQAQAVEVLVEQFVPLLLNIAAGTLAAAMLLLWSRRRSEEALGCFAALTLLCALRNCAYFLHQSLLPPTLVDWLFFCAQTWSVVLLGHFVLLWTGGDGPGLRRVLRGVAWLWPLVAVLAAWAGRLDLARTWLYPWLLLLTLPSLGLLLRAACATPQAPPRVPAGQVRAMAAGVVLIVAGGLHDYLYQIGELPVTRHYLVPWLLPLLLLLFSAQWLQRLVQALAEAERGRELLEQRVAERTRALQDAHAGTARFLAAASHDLRQPMVGIGLLAGLLQEQAPPGPLLRLTQRLGDAVLAMEGLLKRLLDLSRLEAGVVRARWQPVDLGALLQATVDQQLPLAERKGLQLRMRPHPAELRLHLRSDPALLEQVLHNLVANAVRHTHEGGVLIALRRRGRATDWQLMVTDTGPGIAPEHQQEIYEDWVRLVAGPGDRPRPADHEAGRRTDGTLEGLGLGLAIARRAAQALGTPVQLRSRPGRGSRFWVEVQPWTAVPTEAPLPAATDARPSLPPEGLAEATLQARLADREVWLLEDDPDASTALTMVLEGWQARVRVLTHAGQAWATLQQARCAPTLWISDQRLPDGRGSDVLAAARARWPDLPALLISGDTAAGDLGTLEAQRALGIPVLHKPFQTAALRAHLLALLTAQRPRSAHDRMSADAAPRSTPADAT
jgi:signal transduction histidine kinase/CheY-like chemotaxis protein